MWAIIGNILWFILGPGFAMFLSWALAGILLCITVIGIPFGIAAFRIAVFVAFPFGHDLVDARMLGRKRIIGTTVANVLWVLLAGIWLAILHILSGIGWLLMVVTIIAIPIAIPFALAHFKLAGICFAPLGKVIVSKDYAESLRRPAKA